MEGPTGTETVKTIINKIHNIINMSRQNASLTKAGKRNYSQVKPS